MSYEVLVENLREAAGRMRSTTAPLAGYDFHSSNVTGESFGHVELAEWFEAVADQCDKAGAALRSGAEALAGQLEYAATNYEQTDEGVADSFRAPLSSGVFSSGPFGSAPFGATP
jgi:uncharacterized protein YukE